ncbi:hypothetical protein RhiirA4_465938 [Rhizophagus irregularis]|uniref:Uncharacterized protein n=1 Tax=Rhizophagus irregularis TaxID=588596 RepID=A0A2I1GT36_9GLOM|nr:hypothetical protein RhiirA4_465938 [Rhizophagus irregularis]
MKNNNNEVLLYKKKDTIAIQKKLGINANANQTAIYQNKKVKPLADSYELLLNLVEGIIPIQEELDINGNSILAVKYQSNKAFTDILLAEIYNLILYLKENIMAIQQELGIIGYTNQKMVKETDKNARAYFQKFDYSKCDIKKNL